jgi:NitT/TauT family transport system substrate-binding protein
MRVGWCAKTVSGVAAPFAVAAKMGWFEKAGFKVQLVPLPGSTDCVKSVATKDILVSLASIEPLAIISKLGVKAKNYYTAYQGNIYGLAVPQDSTVQSIRDLQGKKIGVTSMASGGVIVARALAVAAGLNPDKDISIVVAGESAQAAAMVRGRQVDALSQFDASYALVRNAGVKLRRLDHPEIAKFPSNGFIALDETLMDRRTEAVALAQGYAKGTIFTMTNPEAALRILFEVYPYTKGTGRDEATAIASEANVIRARVPNWKLAAGGVAKWGFNAEANYAAYMEWLLKNGVLKEQTAIKDIITNALIDDINAFDPAEIAALAKDYKAN